MCDMTHSYVSSDSRDNTQVRMQVRMQVRGVARQFVIQHAAAGLRAESGGVCRVLDSLMYSTVP